ASSTPPAASPGRSPQAPTPTTSTATTEPAVQPVILDTPAALRRESERWRAAGLSVGLVPTMGALHAGHRSLLRRARAECDRVVASIFVNPTQFAAGEDLGRYPRTLDADLAMLAEERVDALLLPSVAAVYPPGVASAGRGGGTARSRHEAWR